MSTPLVHASLCGHLKVVELLLEAHAAIDKADEDFFSPLAAACCNLTMYVRASKFKAKCKGPS